MSRFIYVVVPSTNSKWDEIKIILNQKEAYATSVLYPRYRIELFVIGLNGYQPTNDYIQNGKYLNSEEIEISNTKKTITFHSKL